MPADAAATPSSSVSTLQQRIDELIVELRARTAERDEAVQRERALAEILQVINSSPGDLAPVFDAMLEKATELCGAEFGCLFLYDGQAFTVVADRNLPSEYAQRLRGQHFSAETNSVLRNMVENKAPVHVTNMFDAAYSRREPLRTLTLELGGVRSLITVPLLNKTQLIGFFSIYKGESGGFAEDQIALVSTFANQAVIAIENTRLITEIREALEQQSAAADMLGVINSSPGDLAPVIDTMLEKATRLCDAAYGVLWTYDGHTFHGAAARGVPPELLAFLREPQAAMPGTGIGRLLDGEPYVHLEDLKESEAYRRVSPIARAVADLGGAHSNIMVPLRSDAAFLGAISVFRREVRPFSDKQIALLQNFAAQAVMAMANARLLTEQREALEQQIATAEVLQVINSSPGNPSPVFETILEKAHALCGVAYGSLQLYDGDKFRAVAVQSQSKLMARRLREGFTPGPNHPAQRLLAGEDYIHIGDWAEIDDPMARLTVEEAGIRTMLSVALRKDGKLLGRITAGRQEVRPFTDKEISLVRNFADQAVIAIENARLFGELRDRQAELRVTIDNMGGGVAMFDADLRLTAWNRNIQQILDLSDEDLARRPTYDEYLRMLAGRGEYGTENVEGTLSGFLEDPGKELRFEHIRPDGTVVEVRRNPVPGGGFVVIYIDITARKKAEAEIAAARDAAETALERQTATADILRVIASSPSDVHPVFDAIAERSNHLIAGSSTAVYRLADDVVHLMSFTSVNPEADAALKALYPMPLARSPAFQEAIRTREVQRLRDTELEFRNDADALSVARLRGFRSRVLVPLIQDGEPIGIIGVTRAEPGLIADEHVELLKTFADQAVIAIRNARLFNELREALEQQTATAEVLQVINSSPGNLKPVLDAMLDRAVHLTESAFGIMNLYEEGGHRVVALHGVLDSVIERWSAAPQSGPEDATARFVEGEDVVQIEDLKVYVSDRQGAHRSRALVEIGGARSFLAVALRKDGKLLGSLTTYRQEVRPFTHKEISLLKNFAAQAVIAMENARLLGELRERTDQVAELNRGLEARVAEQVEELGRVGRLKRFLAPQLAELIVSQGDEKILESHRREIVVVFCDLRGYTAFTETAEPEEVLDFLREYHGALGPLISQFEGTLDQFSGDGIMVFFNDPVPIPDPAERAVKMAVAMREVASTLIAAWRERGRELGFGAGVAQGYATLGQIGFSERSGYTAIGTVCNVAARLCGEAKDGQILLSQRINVALNGRVATEQVGALSLKGFTQPVVAYNVPLKASQPALSVIDRGNH